MPNETLFRKEKGFICIPLVLKKTVTAAFNMEAVIILSKHTIQVGAFLSIVLVVIVV